MIMGTRSMQVSRVYTSVFADGRPALFAEVTVIYIFCVGSIMILSKHAVIMNDAVIYLLGFFFQKYLHNYKGYFIIPT